MKNMKMKLLDYTLMGLLAGMAAAQAQAQEATAPAPASPQLDCTGDACTSDEGLLFKLRTRSYDVPVTTGTSEQSSSEKLQPDRRVSIGLLDDHIAHCVVNAAHESAETGNPEIVSEKVAEATAAISRLLRS